MAPSTELAERTPAQELASQVRSPEFQSQIAAALPGNLLPDRFVRATVTALMTNPDLAAPDVDRNSIFQALLRSAQDGLLPDGREAAITVYKDNKNGGKRAQYLPMIGGFRKIAGDHGWSIRAVVVYANDEFEFELGLEPNIVHRPVRPGMEKGERIAAYAVGAHGDGRREVEVMDAAQIAKVKTKAQTTKVWDEWTDRMWEKTVGKALFKRLPIGELDERVARVIEAADATDADESRTLMYGGEVTPAGEVANGNVPADGADGSGTTADAADQQAGADSSAPAPDFPDEPSTDDEPGFPLPADVEAVKLAADAAGQEVILNGGHKDDTIAQVAAKPKGPGWVRWCIVTRDHPNSKAAETYARVYLPEEYQAALAEVQAKAQV